MTYQEALKARQARSFEFQSTCYVNAVLVESHTDKPKYYLSDWLDGSTVARFTNGKRAERGYR